LKLYELFKLLLSKKEVEIDKKITYLSNLLEKYLSNVDDISEEQEMELLYEIEYTESKIDSETDMMKSMLYVEDWLLVKSKKD
jgi:hypothetical protein